MLAAIIGALAWILAFGVFCALAFALDTPGTDGWYDRWIVKPFVLLFVFGGAALIFTYFGVGWFH